jgi:predicted patatin/cPLA2 family phospholipase
LKTPQQALIIQGGGFKTAFTTGVLDAFLEAKHNPFMIYAGVSGGANALSYYLADQHGSCIASIDELMKDTQPKLSRIVKTGTILNVDFFHEIADSLVPLDMQHIIRHQLHKKIGIVMTNRETGNPHYFEPSPENWVEALIASCALPFVSKGKHTINGVEYMDGGWSDPIPVEWAIRQGATDITVIRTSPAQQRQKQALHDYLGSLYHRKDEVLKTVFAENHLRYNQTLDFIEANPHNVTIRQIAPAHDLQTGSFTKMKKALYPDYEYGVKLGREYLDLLAQETSTLSKLSETKNPASFI